MSKVISPHGLLVKCGCGHKNDIKKLTEKAIVNDEMIVRCSVCNRKIAQVNN